jgi:endo-1,3(4)-beta-glucanase
MKKSALIGFGLASALLLTGCQHTLTNSSDSLISSNDTTGDVSFHEGGTSSNPSSQGSSAGTSSGDHSSSSGGDSSSSEPEPVGDVSFSGVDNAVCAKGHYFDPFKGVTAKDKDGVDATKYINVYGSVQYGTLGNYTLRYEVKIGESVSAVTRTVSVQDVSYTHPSRNRSDEADQTVSLGSGSYRTGNAPVGTTNDGNEFHRAPNPAFFDNEVFNQGPLPSNKWWTGFTVADYGNMSGNPTLICQNPLNAGMSAYGLFLSQKWTGNTQYFSVADTKGVQQTTMENFGVDFSLDDRDIYVKPATLSGTNYAKVTAYDANSVQMSLRNSMDGEDEMHMHFVQGSPFVFTEFKDPSKITLDLRVAGINGGYQFYDLSGNALTGTYKGSQMVIQLAGSHIGYNNVYPSTAVGGAVNGDLYYLVSAPANTTFTIQHGDHPDSTKLNQVVVSMSEGNYLSIGELNMTSARADASFFGGGAYALPGATHYSYDVDFATSVATTTFHNNVQFLNGKEAAPLFALLPHQWRHSSAAVSAYTLPSFRGTTKIFAGNGFSTTATFRGMVPSFTLPSDASLSTSDMESYLAKVAADTVPGSVDLSWKDSDKDFVNAPGPYWCGKAFYPLAQGLIVADQMGESTYKSLFLERLEWMLQDWLTYSGNGDVRYLYYDKVWGSMYYSVDNFSNNSRLSDHHFTAGYLVYAMAVTSMYDPSFLTNYGDLARLLLDDYMNDGHSDSLFPRFRTYDVWAGHSWADGLGTFGDGEDQESCGEALNSWNAGYLLGVALGDEALVSASAWGYSNELEAVKQYWFNYSEDNWSKSLANYVHVIAILWGDKNAFATFFGSNPEFIYGIHWLPTGEYLTNYALGAGEKAMLLKIYNELLSRVSGAPRTWYSYLWAIQAVANSATALTNWDASKILADDYPDEIVGSYWMIHALQTLGNKDVSGALNLNANVAASVYLNGTTKQALLWNPSSQDVTLNYVSGSSSVSVTAKARSFSKATL